MSKLCKPKYTKYVANKFEYVANKFILTLGICQCRWTFIRASPSVLTQKGWYCFVTNKTIKIFLSQNKFIKAWQRQTPRIFNCFTNII